MWRLEGGNGIPGHPHFQDSFAPYLPAGCPTGHLLVIKPTELNPNLEVWPGQSGVKLVSFSSFFLDAVVNKTNVTLSGFICLLFQVPPKLSCLTFQFKM